MGYMCHHAILVISWNDKLACKAHRKAREIFNKKTHFGEAIGWVSPLSPPLKNDYRSFFVSPDGSKEGWEDSNTGNVLRKCFLAWLDAQRHDDNSSSLVWAEVELDEDLRKTKVTQHSFHRRLKG